MPTTKLFYKGKPLATYCRQNDIEYSSVYWHIKNGRSIQSAIETVQKRLDVDPEDDFLDRCIHCKKIPQVAEICGLFYVQCHCGKWNPYFFMGARQKAAKEKWNFYNRPIAYGRKK